MASNTYSFGAQGQAGVWLMADGNSVRLDPEIEDRIRKIRPDESQIITLLEGIGNSAPSKQMTFQWQEEWDMEFKVVLAGAEAAAATVIDVGDAAMVVAGDILFCPRTNEAMAVTSVATNAITVVRGYGDVATTGPAMTAGETLINLGNATAEAANPPHLRSRGTDNGSLYIQQITSAAGLSEWEEKSGQRGGPEMVRLTDQSVRLHKGMRERFALLGRPEVTTETGGTYVMYLTAGLRYFCQQKNQCSFGGAAANWDACARFLSHIYQYGNSKKRYGFCGTNVLYNIISWPEVQRTLRTDPGHDTVGFNIHTITGPFGELRLVEHPLMNEAVLNKELLVTDLGDMKRRFLQGTSYRVQKNIQTPASFRTEWCIDVYDGWEHLNTMGAGVISGFS